MRYETRLAPARLPLSHPHRPAGRTRDAHLDDHHRVRPRRALLPPLVCSRPDDPRDDGFGPTSTPRSCLENHADGSPWVRPTRRGRVASSHARRFPRRRRLPRDRRRAAPRGSRLGRERTRVGPPGPGVGIPPRRAGRQFRHPPDLRRATRAPPRPRLPRFLRRRSRRARTITPASNHRRVRHRRRLFRARLSIRKHTRRLDRRVLVRVREHAPRRAPERALATSRARRPAERRRWTRPRTPGPRRPDDHFGRRARLAPGRVVGFRRARRSARRRDGDV